jgi:membrane-bound ClpP family serine protease
MNSTGIIILADAIADSGLGASNHDLIVICFLTGLVLLALDVFVASFLMGMLGALAMLVGCVFVWVDYGALAGGLAAVGALALLAIAIWLELVVLPKTKFGRGLVVQSKVDATSQPPLADAAAVVGQSAEAVTVLAPSGYVLVAGRRYEAFCQSGHAAKGAALRVTGMDNFKLIVTHV